MSLASWLANRWLQVHQPAAGELAALLAVVDREIADAAVKGLSVDAQLTHTYNAGLQLATAALAAAGYRPSRERAHERAIGSLAFTIGSSQDVIDLLDLTRRRRNQANYEQVGMATETEVADLRTAVLALRAEVVRRIKA